MHLRQTLDQALIGYGGVFGCLRVANCRRSRLELRYKVRPHRFGTGSLVRDRFDSVPDRRTAVGAGGTFKDAFVVVNEEARRDKDLRQALLHLVKLNRASDGVGGTAAKLSLVINRWALPTQIDSRWQSSEHCHRRGIKEIAVIGQIRDPAKPFS